ncbi:MAG: rhombosortase [Gammaproteobacteria bacterium]|nr:rhombosortase [Gammaproteobacteria bacterium]
MLERLAPKRFQDWLLPGGIGAVLLALYCAGPSATAALRYELAAITHGEIWRLATGHLVHADGAHLAWNLAGLGLVWLLFAREFTVRGWLVVLLASTAAIDLGFLAFEPRLEWYVGFSGVLHGCMAAGLVSWLNDERDVLTAVVAMLFAAKLVYEHAVGPLPFTSGSMAYPVVYQAHTYGAIGGAAAAMWLLRRRRVSSAPL